MYGFVVQSNGRLVTPGTEYEAGAGTHVCPDLRAWNDILAMRCPVLDGETVREATSEELAAWFPPPVVRWSRRKIVLKLKERGLWEAWNQFLAANPDVADVLDAVVEVWSNDQTFLQVFPAFCAFAGISAQDGWDLLAECVVDE